MQSWLEYLAFLSWQNQILTLEDFKRVFQNQEQIHSVTQLSNYISHPNTKHYLRIQKDWWKQTEKDQKFCQLSGIQTAWPFHPNYPTYLLQMEYPPVLISWKGQACWKDHFLFSLVGSRQPYQDTLLWMEMYLSIFLKKRKEKFCLMSGGARGVDQKAHALCLASQKPTICFLPCGIKNYYPADLKKWEKEVIGGGGAFVSIFPMSEPMRKSHFHKRNKVLAFLSHLIFIAQAQSRSGTMVTARYALHAGTTIAALPGSPLYTGYKGNLSLINDGCFMIRDHIDLETLYQSCLLNINRHQSFVMKEDLNETIKHDPLSPTKP